MEKRIEIRCGKHSEKKLPYGLAMIPEYPKHSAGGTAVFECKKCDLIYEIPNSELIKTKGNTYYINKDNENITQIKLEKKKNYIKK